MIDERISAAFEHSPRHRKELQQELAGVHGHSVYRAAVALAPVIRRMSIGDFPNPFSRDTDYGRPRAEWQAGFDGKENPYPGTHTSEQPVPQVDRIVPAEAEKLAEFADAVMATRAVPEPLDWKDRKVTKAMIANWMWLNFGADVDVTMTRAELVEAAKALMQTG